MAAAHLIDGDDPELVVDEGDSRSTAELTLPRNLEWVMPDPGWKLVFFKLDDVV